MLSGDNGILQKAADAKTKSDEAQIRERIQLAYHSALTKDITGENRELTMPTLQTELNNEFAGKTVTIAHSADNKEWTIKVDNVEENVPAGKRVLSEVEQAIENGQMLDANSVKNITDEKGNIIKVPKGFKIASDSGTTVSDGIVIEDAVDTRSTFGSQFVWVPVGTIKKNDGTEATITLGRYKFNSPSTANESPKQTASKTQYTKEVVINNYYCEYATKKYLNTIAKSLGTFISSAIDNGGYYIARYEAGIKGTNESDTNDKQGGLTKNSTTSGYIVSKADVGVWNNITQLNAATVCQNMYSTVNSDLVNSYSWDTAIMFIEKCGENNNYANQGRLRTVLTKTGIASNGTNKDVQCNIYDMAGNVYEWSTETMKASTSPCVARGSSYGRK